MASHTQDMHVASTGLQFDGKLDNMYNFRFSILTPVGSVRTRKP